MAAAALLAVAAQSTSAQSEELKIGYVNSDRVLRDAAPAKAAQAKLEAEFGKREKELSDLAAKLKTQSDKLEKEGPALAEAERSRRQRDLVEQDRDFQRKRREFQEDLNQRKNEELASVVERANRVIKQIFDTEKYDLILQEAVFAGPRLDITDKVIKALNAQGTSSGK
ncbi:OmpH family outer membrane protein [soil metagenome]